MKNKYLKNPRIWFFLIMVCFMACAKEGEHSGMVVVYRSLSEALVEPEQVFQLDLGRKNLRAYRRRSAN